MDPADGWICGRVTMEAFAGGVRPEAEMAHEHTQGTPREDFVASGEYDSFAFAIDARGRLAWESNDIDGDHVVAILSELEELQSIVGPPTDGSVSVRDPAWLTHFRLHHRQIAHYRQGRVFLAGDAAHIHSPVGAQGMNTGIQDAWNLGWKLALVANGAAKPEVLDSYEAERWPVGRFLLQYTDRIFGTFTRAMSTGRFATWARETIVPRILPRLFASSRLRTAAFRFVSELDIHYRRSPAVAEGIPRLRSGPRAGHRACV